jgi:lipopolysaccharide transport system permease protein
VNPHAPALLSIKSLLSSVFKHRFLVAQMTRREIVGRYKGSVLGLFWSFVTPVILLTMYTLVFSVVFKARWGTGPSGSRSEFATFLFVGMIVHSLFAEVLTRAPTLILANVNLVKKVVFPLELLPLIAVGTSLFHSALSLLALAAAVVLLQGALPWTWVFIPIILLPLVLLALGFAWVLSSLGVFIRDVAHPIGLLMTLLLFASPVFYPVSALPQSAQHWVALNPLTFIIEQARSVLIVGAIPSAGGLLVYSAVAAVVAWLGYAWFQKTRKGFANVL